MRMIPVKTMRRVMKMKKKLPRRYVLVNFTLFNSFQCVLIGKQYNAVQPEAGKKRVAENALKAPASDKKAKVATPSGQKTGV
jgi:hypothetical protein